VKDEKKSETCRMGNSYRTLTVILSDDIDKDYIDNVVDAIGMVRGVADVVTGEPVDATTFQARRIAHDQLKERLRKALAMDLNNAEFYYDLVERNAGK